MKDTAIQITLSAVWGAVIGVVIWAGTKIIPQ